MSFVHVMYVLYFYGVSLSINWRSGDELMKIASLLFGMSFKILLSCDLISNMADVETGVFFAILHC